MTVKPTYTTDTDIDLDLPAVTKRNWKTTESRDRWQHSLDVCSQNLYRVEVMAVIDSENPREVAVIDTRGIDPNNVFALTDTEGLAVRVHDGGNTLVVGKDRSAVQSAQEALRDDDHFRLGNLLGYPLCCSDCYETDVAEYEPYEVPIYEMACASPSALPVDDNPEHVRVENVDGMNNPIWQYMGWTFTSHRPCSFECEETRDLALKAGAYFRELGLGEEAEDMFQFLSENTTWDGYHGLSNIRNGYAIGSTNTPEYWSNKVVEFGGPHELKKL